MTSSPTPAVVLTPCFSEPSIRAHTKLLHSLAKGCKGKFVVSAFNDDAPGTITHHKIGDIDGMVEAILVHALTPGANAYLGLHLMRSDLPRGKRGTTNDIAAVLGLVVDMDADTGRIGTMPMTPSYVVETSPGNNQSAILFDHAMAPDQAATLAKALRKATKSDFCTGDIAHVWRIPGTLNYPNTAKIARGRSAEPVTVRLTAPFVGEVYGGEQLSEILLPYITESEAAQDADTKFAESVDTAPLWERLTDIGRMLLTADGQPDRSRHAAKVVEQLHFEGFSLDEAVSLCGEAGKWTDRYNNEAAFVRDIERCWNRFGAPKDAQRRANAQGAENFINRHSKTKDGSGSSANPNDQSFRAVKATPFVFRDPKTIPARKTLYAGHFNRRFLSTTFGVGGGGKSTLLIADALASASAPILNRAVEHAIKLALTVSVATNCEQPVITGHAMKWAVQLAWLSVCTMIEETCDRISDNLREADLKRIFGHIKKAGQDGITEGTIADRCGGIEKRRRTELLEDLVLAGRIEERSTPTGGRPKKRYYLL